MNKLKKLLLYIFFVIITIFIIANRLYVRSAKELPLNINFYLYLSFYLICLLLIISIILFYFNNFLQKWYIYFITQFKTIFDFILPKNFLFHVKILSIIQYLFKKQNLLFKIYILANYFIRILVVTIFTVDVFYYRTLLNFYKTLPLMLIPLIFRIFYFMMKRSFELELLDLGSRIQIYCFNSGPLGDFITLEDCLNKKVLASLKKIDVFNYNLILDSNFVENWQKAHNAKINRKVVRDFYKNFIDNNFYKIQTIFFLFSNKKSIYDKYINILVRLGYFIGWSYIFYISDPIHFLLLIEFFINCIQLIEEPFSGLLL